MAKMAIVNPIKKKPVAVRKVDMWRNPVAPMTKSTVLALNDKAYKTGLLAGRKSSIKRKTRRNPIGVSDVMDMAADAGMGAAGSIAVDLAAGFIFPKIGLSKANNSVVYAAAKSVMAVAAGEIFADMTKGASYKFAAGSLTVTLAELAKVYLAPKLPTGVTLGALPNRGNNLPYGTYITPAPVIPAMLAGQRNKMVMAGTSVNRQQYIPRARGMGF